MFSVVVPSYNHAPYLFSAVVSALQSELVREILVVDDGSSDGSRSVIQRLVRSWPDRVRELSRSGERNRGAHERLNELVAAAREPWVAVLNSDDAFVAGRFEILRTHGARGAEFLCGSLSIFDEDGSVIGSKCGAHQPEYAFSQGIDVGGHLERGSLVPLLANQNFIATTSNMVFTRSLHARVGGFRDYRYVHDWDFALRAAAMGRCCALPHFLATYRSHPANTIRENRQATADEVQRLLRQFLVEFPQWGSEPDFVRALRGNRYLDAKWLVEHGVDPEGQGTIGTD